MDARPDGWQEITIRIPTCNPDASGYISKERSIRDHVDVRLRGAQLEGLRRTHAALHESHAQLSSGKHVDSIADVIRWIFENIGEELATLPPPT